MPATPPIVSHDWLKTTSARENEAIWLILFDLDIQSAQIALDDYLAARDALTSFSGPGVDRVALARVLHNAKVFVCAMRRLGRLLESMAANRSVFPPRVANAVQLAWKKHRSFLRTYQDPRNAIEHIDGEVKGRTEWRMVNVVNDELEVVPGRSAKVSGEALEVTLNIRSEIVEALKKDLPS